MFVQDRMALGIFMQPRRQIRHIEGLGEISIGCHNCARQVGSIHCSGCDDTNLGSWLSKAVSKVVTVVKKVAAPVTKPIMKIAEPILKPIAKLIAPIVKPVMKILPKPLQNIAAGVITVINPLVGAAVLRSAKLIKDSGGNTTQEQVVYEGAPVATAVDNGLVEGQYYGSSGGGGGGGGSYEYSPSEDEFYTDENGMTYDMYGNIVDGYGNPIIDSQGNPIIQESIQPDEYGQDYPQEPVYQDFYPQDYQEPQYPEYRYQQNAPQYVQPVNNLYQKQVPLANNYIPEQARTEQAQGKGEYQNQLPYQATPPQTYRQMLQPIQYRPSVQEEFGPQYTKSNIPFSDMPELNQDYIVTPSKGAYGMEGIGATSNTSMFAITFSLVGLILMAQQVYDTNNKR